MHLPPNEVYSAFSFIGFVFCVIPFYWHLKGKVRSHLNAVLFLRMIDSSEYKHLLVYDLDRSGMPLAMCQLDRMEQEHD